MVKAEDPLLTLECDKATMDVPSPAAGTVTGLKVKVGDRVGEGTLILHLQTGAAKPAAAAPQRPRHRAHGTDAQARRGRQGRLPRRGAGAGRRPGRLHGRVPRRRSGPPGGAGRALADPGRRLPERRLHPLQGAAARRQGDRRDRGDGPFRRQVRRPDGRPRRPARLEGRRGQEADRRPVRASPRRARSRCVSGHGPVHLAQSARGRGRQGRQEDRELRAGDHRRRLRARDAAVHPARRSAGDRFHRCLGAGRRAQAAPGRGRRDHRAGDGDGLPCAGCEGDHRRADGPDHPRRRQGPGHAAPQEDRQALREHLPQGQGDQGRGQAGRPGGQLRGRLAHPPPTPSTASWWRWAASPTAR